MVFASARRDGRFLEIGPAHNAILPKREGFDTRTVDYLDRAGLVEKYADFDHYDPADIEEVDYVLAPDATMLKEIDERFDLVLASHVLEHTTSLIDFLNECTGLLADRGVLALVVPDHRYCFDRFRERSSLGRVIDTSLAPPPVHTVGTLTEFALNAVRHGSTGSWSAGHQGKYRLMHDLDTVRQVAAKADGDDYVDVHNWIFSPHHLRLMIEDLHSLGYITLRECFFSDTVGHEFFLNLSLDGPGPGLTRERLLARADRERRVDKPVFARRKD
jgi:SAM-dependent methyltransferase